MERMPIMNEYEERNQEMIKDLEVNRITDGLGYGEGGISHQARRDEVGTETLQKVEELITGPEILVEVSTDKQGQPLDDDGCGDGRKVHRVFEGGVEKRKSLHRSKVFGGGATMASAMQIGSGQATGMSLQSVFSQSLGMLRDKMIDFGGHTDTNAHDGSCGCGAIDKAPTIVQNAVKFEAEIRGSIQALKVDDEGLDEVFGAYRDYATEIEGQDYAGAAVMDEIMDNGKIVKELDDKHKEMYVVLNTIEGYTVNQEKVREASDEAAQIFAVDVWRNQQLADRLFADQPEDVRHKAFLSELVYTLATAATLTKGDLPVFVASKKPELVAA
jgi:hypothetical protein